MTDQRLTGLIREVQRVRRRLFFQRLVDGIGPACVVAGASFLFWRLLRVLVAPDWDSGIDLLAGSVAVTLVGAWVIFNAVRRTPTLSRVALSIDERFQLRERLTTALSIPSERIASAAGQAILDDAIRRTASLRLTSRFPIRPTRRLLGLPVALAAVGLAMWLTRIPLRTVLPDSSNPDAAALDPAATQALEQLKERLATTRQSEQNPNSRPSSPDLEEIQARLEQILNQPLSTPDDVRQRLAEVSSLEENARKTEQRQAEILNGLKEHLSKLDRSKRDLPGDRENSDMANQHDAVDSLRQALAEGDTATAKQELDRLSKRLKDEKLQPQEVDHLKKEMERLQEDLAKLAEDLDRELQERKKALEQRLAEQKLELERQLAEKRIDRQEYERRKKNIEEHAQAEGRQIDQQRRQLQQLQQNFQQCERCLGENDREGAASALRDAGKQLDELQRQMQAHDELQNELQRIRDAREALAEACDRPGKSRSSGGSDDAQELTRRREGTQDPSGSARQGANRAGVGLGRRPDGKPMDTESADARQRTHFDRQGAKIQVGVAGQAERVIGKTSVTIQGEIQQVAQEAPEAIENQRIPRGYKDTTKGYFRNIGQQKLGGTPPQP